MDIIQKLTANLNKQQLEAVSETEGYVRVIAGAGSGKTKALTTRYAYIVKELGINSSNILCVTFTNKAAQEMRKRVKKIIGESSDLSYITTYHGFCVRFLREDINKIKYPKNFIIMDVEDQKTVLRQIYSELGFTSKDVTFKQMIRHIGQEKKSHKYMKYILESKKKKREGKLDQIFLRYLEKQQRNFALDFNDLINFTLYILLKNPDVLDKWQKRLHYIQVDETQDSSTTQFALVEMLSRYHQNLFVVGDPDQTIYEWRGAKPTILVNFDKQYPDSKTIIMNQNYRSTPNILNIGNHLIKNNTIRVAKDMFTQKPEGVEVVHFHGKDEQEEGLWIANEIKSLVADKACKYSEFAILYRANYISRMIEQSLIKENIPYTIYGGIRFFERKEIKDILSYLRLIEFGDDFSLLRAIRTPRRGLGKKFVGNLAKIATKSDKSLYETLKAHRSNNGLNRKGANEFIELIEGLRGLKDKLSISDLVKEVLDKTGLTAFYRTDGDTDRLDNIKELQNSIIIQEKDYEEQLTLTEYLQEIALYTNMDVDEDKFERVKLMTIHTSKGLEFPYVFLCGFTEGIIPSAMSLKERRAKALEEERRLAYVAITRAEKAFYMTECEGYNFISKSSRYPSRFLFEINDNYYVRKGELDQEIIDEAKEWVKTGSTKESIHKKLNIGDIIIHKIWNKGKVIDINEKKGEYQIEFFEEGKIKPITFEYEGISLLRKSTPRRNSEVGKNSTKNRAKRSEIKKEEVKAIKSAEQINKEYTDYRAKVEAERIQMEYAEYRAKEAAEELQREFAEHRARMKNEQSKIDNAKKEGEILERQVAELRALKDREQIEREKIEANTKKEASILERQVAELRAIKESERIERKKMEENVNKKVEVLERQVAELRALKESERIEKEKVEANAKKEVEALERQVAELRALKETKRIEREIAELNDREDTNLKQRKQDDSIWSKIKRSWM